VHTVKVEKVGKEQNSCYIYARFKYDIDVNSIPLLYPRYADCVDHFERIEWEPIVEQVFRGDVAEIETLYRQLLYLMEASLPSNRKRKHCDVTNYARRKYLN
jgi:hypothetical protein